MAVKIPDIAGRVTDGDSRDIVLSSLCTLIREKIPLTPTHQGVPETFVEWLQFIASTQFKSFSFRMDHDKKELDAGLSQHTPNIQFYCNPDLKHPPTSAVQDVCLTGRYFEVTSKFLSYRPHLEVIEGNIFVTTEIAHPLRFCFHISDEMEETFDLSRRHLQTKLNMLEELYQKFKETVYANYILFNLGIPEGIYILPEDLPLVTLFYQIRSKIFVGYHGFSQEFPLTPPLKLTRYITRKLKVTDDVFTSYVSENVDFTLEFLKGDEIQTSFLNNKGLVDFYSDPMGISSCMTGKDRQYCVDSYKHNPNCGLAVFKKRGQVKARSLVYMTDAGLKVHCNVYSIMGISAQDCREELRNLGFTDIRELYGMIDLYFGRDGLIWRHRDMFAIKKPFSTWLNNSPLPNDCAAEMLAALETVENKEDPFPEFFQWIQKWFSLTFVTNEQHNLPFLDSFGMWKVIARGKNLSLQGLPLRSNLGNPEWKDLRTPAGPGEPYKIKNNSSSKDTRLFDTEEEYQKYAAPRRGYTEANKGWLKCQWTGKWFNPDVWGYYTVCYTDENRIEQSGYCLPQHYVEFRPGTVYLYDRESKLDYWAYKLTFIKALGIYLRFTGTNEYVTYDKEKAYHHPKTGMFIIEDENVILRGFNEPEAGADDPVLENTGKTFEDLQFIEVVELKNKKKEKA